jgi:NodT family efflux transporter outer membrane factor (OMF) lipoprotein
MKHILHLAPIALLVTGCEVGPDYQRPTAPIAAKFKEQEGWKPAEPREAASGSPWWSVYDDPVLDGLEQQIEISNQTLKQSEASYREAVAIVQQANATLFPTLSLGNSDARTAQSSSSFTGSTTSSSRSGSVIRNQFSVTASASWVPDIWGKIRRTIDADVATAQASAADIAAAKLTAQATLATDYFELRVQDANEKLLDNTIAAYQHAYDITQNQYKVGVAAKADVITALTQLQGAEAQRINLEVARAQLEHAIAMLIGKTPDSFAIAATDLTTHVPVMPTGVASSLLERRPDIAAAERTMASANEEIGVAIAAYYPDLTLSPSYGFSASSLSNLFQASNAAWSIGGQLTETVFDAGARAGAVAQARAVYDADIANYRQTVLTAFQGVEDQLAALRILEQETNVAEATVKSAEEAVRLTLNEYKAGTVAYTAVVTAQATALSDEESLLTIRQNRLTASVALIEDLGGGWASDQLPNRDQIEAAEASSMP